MTFQILQFFIAILILSFRHYMSVALNASRAKNFQILRLAPVNFEILFTKTN